MPSSEPLPALEVADRFDNKFRMILPLEQIARVNPSRSAIELEEKRQEAETNILSYLKSDIFDAIVKLNINSDYLKELYHGLQKSPETFEQLAQESPSDIEIRIAEYVAFGTESLTTYELLEQPLFYQALHKVINMENFEKAKQEARKIYEVCQTNSEVKTDVERPSYKKMRRTEALPVNVSSKTNKRRGPTYKEAVCSRWKIFGIRTISNTAEDTVGIQPSIRTITRNIQRKLGLPTKVAFEYALALPELNQMKYQN